MRTIQYIMIGCSVLLLSSCGASENQSPEKPLKHTGATLRNTSDVTVNTGKVQSISGSTSIKVQ